jgi:hypothetical protein
MHLKNIFSGLLILISISLLAENKPIFRNNEKKIPSADSVQLSIDYLKKILQPMDLWQSDNPEILRLVKGLIHFAEDEHIDSILVRLERFQQQKDARYINRLPIHVSDSLKVPGYLSYPAILEKMKQLDREIWNGVDMKTIPLPESLKADAVDKIQKSNLDSAITAYRNYAVRVFSDSLQNQLRDSLKLHNEQKLAHYNDSIVRSVNDSINRFVQTLQRYAQNDSVCVWVHSLTGRPSQLWLRNNLRSINRLYIKNQQNDSLAIRVMNLDKHSLGIAIDDDVTFARLVRKQGRTFAFEKPAPNQNLNRIQKKFNVLTPWDYGGNGTFGFTQTYLNNWKKGGESAFSFLMVLKGYANYSDSKIRWENSGELRNGWIRQGGSVDQTQKNDDKIELISRLGVSAFDHWFYSAEIDFETQFFNGYNYPDKTKLISTYMSPAKTMFKLGLDYKPNKNFSLFLSPITAKNVFVRDTARVDQTKYGISRTSRSLWEPGLNADIRYKINITPQISYETKYKMFINYQEPFSKFDINWENLIVAQLTDRISMTFMLYMLYDDNVTFPTGKMGIDGEEIYKPKMQTKELMTVGFSYKINRHVYKRKKIG